MSFRQADGLVVLRLEWLQRQELDDATPNVPAKTATVARRLVVSIVPPGCEEHLNELNVPNPDTS
jgi:hypothetical protein